MSLLTTTTTLAAPHTVAELQAIFPDSVGQMVSVRAVYTGPDDSLLFDNFGLFVTNRPMHPDSCVALDGLLPDASYAQMEITVEGVLDNRFLETPYLDSNPVPIIHVVGFSSLQAPRPQRESERLRPPIRLAPLAECDSCKFSIILSGGIDANHNHDRYWTDVVEKYNYKIGANYCDTNVTVLYYHGMRRDAQIPQARVKSATQANFDDAIAAIKAKIERCKAAGKHTEFQLLVTNHGDSANAVANGDPPGQICLLGNHYLPAHTLKGKIKELVDAGVDDVYGEFGECYGGAQVDSLKTLADSTNTTSFHLASASSGHQQSYANRACDRDLFEHAFITARATGLSWGRSFAYADSADSAGYYPNENWYRGYGLPKETPQAAESFAKRFTAAGQTLEFMVGRSCSTLCVHFPGNDGETRCANATVEYQQVVGTDTVWTVIRLWNWNVGKKKYFRAWLPGATGRYRIVSHSNGYPTDVRVDCIDSKSLPETPTDGLIYNALAVGSRDQSSAEFNPHLGEDLGGPYSVPWAEGVPLGAIPAYIGANYYDVLDLAVPFVPDPDRPFLYQLSDPATPYVNPGVFKIYASDILDPSGLPLSSLDCVLQVFAPSQPTSEFATTFTLTRGTDGGIEPAEIDLPVLYPTETHFAIGPQQPGTIELDALVLDTSGPGTNAVEPVTAVGSEPQWLGAVPNPFTQGTTMRFSLPLPTRVRLTVYDASGRAVIVLANGSFTPGVHTVAWDGRDAHGHRMPSGIYFVSLDAAGKRQTGRVLLLR